MQAKDSVQFQLKSGSVIVDTKALEEMKAALRSFFDGPDFPKQYGELRQPMQEELRSSAVWIQAGQAGIGAWRLENRQGRLELVHYPPPRRGTSYIYHATMQPTDSGWKVVSFEQERELGPASP
jgi:hypothetical protein